MPSEEPARRPVVIFNLPPCERSWLLHLRDGEPYGISIDGKPYRVKPLKGRGTAFREGDQTVVVVKTVPNG